MSTCPRPTATLAVGASRGRAAKGLLANAERKAPGKSLAFSALSAPKPLSRENASKLKEYERLKASITTLDGDIEALTNDDDDDEATRKEVQEKREKRAEQAAEAAKLKTELTAAGFGPQSALLERNLDGLAQTVPCVTLVRTSLAGVTRVAEHAKAAQRHQAQQEQRGFDTTQGYDMLLRTIIDPAVTALQSKVHEEVGRIKSLTPDDELAAEREAQLEQLQILDGQAGKAACRAAVELELFATCEEARSLLSSHAKAAKGARNEGQGGWTDEQKLAYTEAASRLKLEVEYNSHIQTCEFIEGGNKIECTKCEKSLKGTGPWDRSNWKKRRCDCYDTVLPPRPGEEQANNDATTAGGALLNMLRKQPAAPAGSALPPQANAPPPTATPVTLVAVAVAQSQNKLKVELGNAADEPAVRALLLNAGNQLNDSPCTPKVVFSADESKCSHRSPLLIRPCVLQFVCNAGIERVQELMDATPGWTKGKTHPTCPNHATARCPPECPFVALPKLRMDLLKVQTANAKKAKKNA